MTVACLDSNVLFGALAGRINARPLERYDQILIPSIAVGEFLCGIECDTRRGRAQRMVFDRFINASAVRLVTVTPLTAEYYAKIFTSLKARGTPIPVNDIWIAASAMEHAAELVSNDAHFRNVEMLRVRSV